MMNKMKLITAFRLIQSGLYHECPSVHSCIKHHFGIQAQMQQVPYLSIALRTKGTTVSQLNKVIYEERSIIRIWGLRSTLHYYTIDDWGMICSFLKNKPDWFERRIRKKGIDFDHLFHQAEQIVQKNKFVTRDIMIKEGISPEYLGPWGDLFITLNNKGLICNVTVGNRCACYANRLFWVPNNSFKLLDYEQALNEIILRYFTCYGPATINDLLHWLGLPVSNIKIKIFTDKCRGIDSLIEYDTGLWGISDKYSLYSKLDYENILKDNVFFLGKFDPLLLAYDDKAWIVSDIYKHCIWRKAGHVSGVVVENGEAKATWNYKVKNDLLIIDITKFDTSALPESKLKHSIQKIVELYQCKSVKCNIIDQLNIKTYIWENIND